MDHVVTPTHLWNGMINLKVKGAEEKGTMDHLGYFDLIERYIGLIRDHGEQSIDQYFEGVMECFDSIAHTYVNWEIKAEWDAFIERGAPIEVVMSYEREEDRAFALHTDAFAVIVDYIALQYWKSGRGLTAHLMEAREWVDALMRGFGRLEELLELVRVHHPIAVDMIALGEAEREAERRERAMNRCHVIEEELMMNRWHPSRVEHLIKLGYAAEDI